MAKIYTDTRVTVRVYNHMHIPSSVSMSCCSLNEKHNY